MSALPAEVWAPLPPPPETGRVFHGRRRVRLADTAPGGRLRLDAAARYLQDVASDDVADSRVEDPEHFWIVRRSVIDILTPPVSDGWIDLATWAAGVGPRWAARRTRLQGDAGGLVEAESLWVYVGRASQRPEPLPPHFMTVYGPSAARKVSARLLLPADPPPEAPRRPWPLRFADIDIVGHVNNAAYWEAVEQAVAETGRAGAVRRAVMEFRAEIGPNDEVVLAVSPEEAGGTLWFMAGGATAAVAAWQW